MANGYCLGTVLPYSSKKATRDVAGIQPPTIKSLKPTSSIRVRSGVPRDVGILPRSSAA